jgi:hypothetical protein
MKLGCRSRRGLDTLPAILPPACFLADSNVRPRSVKYHCFVSVGENPMAEV